MRSLVLLCHDPSIPTPQKERFCERIIESLSEDKRLIEIALENLRQLWVRYDTGGISCGRSLRSSLLGKLILLFDEDENTTEGRMLLSILLGMYYDPAFINTNDWYDYEIGHFCEVEFTHRLWLATAAFALGVDEVTDTADWTIDELRQIL